MLEVQKLFQKHFGHPAIHIVQAPGCLELLGNHTEYNQGLVLALAIDKSVFMAVAPRRDGQVELISSAFAERATFSAHEIPPGAAGSWANHMKGVLNELRRRGVHFSGFSAAIHATLPPGAGLGSSAALRVATTLAVRQLYPFTLTMTGAGTPPKRDQKDRLPKLTSAEKLEIARTCQAAEKRFLGTDCGLLAQISSLFGKAFHATEVDCQSLAVEHVPMIGEIAVVVCDSGVENSRADVEQNALRVHCEAAARALGAKSLRSVDLPSLTANKSRLTEREYQCAYHIAGEIQRVIFGARALRDGDFEQFGQYLLQSHESSRDFFHNSCPELDLLVALARSHPACLGARLSGIGFGGATINLVRRDQVESFRRTLREKYGSTMGHPIEPLVCQVVDGAR